MKTLLITGVDQAAGANLATRLSDQFRVVTVSPLGTSVDRCVSRCCRADDVDGLLAVMRSVQPDVTICCGTAAESSWQTPQPVVASEFEDVRALCAAAAEQGSRVVLVSSDCVYRGPWMFHAEDSNCLTDSSRARTIRACEEAVLRTPGGLVLRTHILGWNPHNSGLLEQMLEQLESGRPFDFGHFATPISAGSFAEILAAAIDRGLSGLFNAGGSERITPFRFAEALAGELDLPAPEAAHEAVAAETTLQCRALRRALNVTLPTLRETVRRLHIEFEERESPERPLAEAA